MKTQIWKALVLSTFAFSAAAHAGPESSGGGPSMVCRNADGTIRKAYMEDVFEGIHRWKYQITQTDESPNAQLARAISKIPGDFERTHVTQIAAEVVNKFQFLENGISFYSAPDLGNEMGVVEEESCNIESVGFYENDGTLKVSPALYSVFSNTDRAAFILHEALYKIARDTMSAGDSEGVRHLVAALLSTDAKDWEIKNLLAGVIYSGVSSDILDPATTFADGIFEQVFLDSAPQGLRTPPGFVVQFTPSFTGQYSMTAGCNVPIESDENGEPGHIFKWFKYKTLGLKLSGPQSFLVANNPCENFSVVVWPENSDEIPQNLAASIGQLEISTSSPVPQTIYKGTVVTVKMEEQSVVFLALTQKTAFIPSIPTP